MIAESACVKECTLAPTVGRSTALKWSASARMIKARYVCASAVMSTRLALMLPNFSDVWVSPSLSVITFRLSVIVPFLTALRYIVTSGDRGRGGGGGGGGGGVEDASVWQYTCFVAGSVIDCLFFFWFCRSVEAKAPANVANVVATTPTVGPTVKSVT